MTRSMQRTAEETHATPAAGPASGAGRPVITVVVPTRDRAAILGTTLRSVLAQRGVTFEVVVVDDGSTDATPRAVAALQDERVRFVRHDRPLGVSAARNRGIAEARGEWVAFLDDDDLWAPDKLAEQLAAARSQARRWAVAGAVSVDDALQVLTGEPPLPPDQMMADLSRYNSVPVGASNVLVATDVLSATGGFDPGLRHLADWDLWLRLRVVGPPAAVNRPLVAYRLHAGNATIDTAFDAEEPLREFDTIMNRHAIPADRPALHRWVAWSSLRAGRRRAAVRAYAAAVAGGDLKSILRALVALGHPAVGQRVYYRPLMRRGQEERWLQEARSWIAELADGAAGDYPIAGRRPVPGSAPDWKRPRTRLDRPVLSDEEVERARRERRVPRWTQWDYLHLEGLRRALVTAFFELPETQRAVLDLHCGTMPYRELMPWPTVWGLDVDRHFGRAHVVGDLPVPLRDASVTTVVVTQALHLVDDPVATVTEIGRVLAPGGHVIATIPHLFLAEGEFERHWSRTDLAALFAGWEAVRVRGVDGPGAAAAFVLGRLAMLGARRWRVARALFTPTVLAFNAAGRAVDRLLPALGRRWPHSLLLVARRPEDGHRGR